MEDAIVQSALLDVRYSDEYALAYDEDGKQKPLTEELILKLYQFYYSKKSTKHFESNFRSRISGFDTSDPTLLALKIFEWVTKGQAAADYLTTKGNQYSSRVIESEAAITSLSRKKRTADEFAKEVLENYNILMCALSIMTALRTYTQYAIEDAKSPEDCANVFKNLSVVADTAYTELSNGDEGEKIINKIITTLNKKDK